MLKYAMNQIIKDGDNYYAFVVAVAKRAREIADEAELDDEVLEEKPVQLAVEEFASGKLRVSDTASMQEDK